MVKHLSGLTNIGDYKADYLNYYCGEISDTTKSYLVTNNDYLEFAGAHFDQVFLRVIGSKATPFNYNKLIFIRQAADSSQVVSFYKGPLQTLQHNYGCRDTKQLRRFSDDHSLQPNSNALPVFLNPANPFSVVDETEWDGYQNIALQMDYAPAQDLIIFSVREYATKVLSNPVNWFRDSEYDENFTEAFKTFDNRNGYKELKFGMSLPAVRNLVTLKDDQVAREYSIKNGSYLRWDYNVFDDCSIMFNKKGKLYDISLLKVSEEEQDCDHLLNALTDLLGHSTSFKERFGHDEFTVWKGKKLTIIILRPNNGSLSIDFNSPSLDDSSPADALY